MTGSLADGRPMRVYLAAREEQLWGASLHDDAHAKSEDQFLWSLGPGLQWSNSTEMFSAATRQIKEYFAGHRQRLELPVRLEGTAFQKRVWQNLMEVEYAEAISYGDLAERIGHPAAFRAVGNANGKNRLCLIVPCHRVIAAGGKIGGYSGGLGLKRRLLVHEATVAGKPVPKEFLDNADRPAARQSFDQIFGSGPAMPPTGSDAGKGRRRILSRVSGEAADRQISHS